jgi:hypothetical protein
MCRLVALSHCIDDSNIVVIHVKLGPTTEAIFNGRIPHNVRHHLKNVQHTSTTYSQLNESKVAIIRGGSSKRRATLLRICGSCECIQH